MDHLFSFLRLSEACAGFLRIDNNALLWDVLPQRALDRCLPLWDDMQSHLAHRPVNCEVSLSHAELCFVLGFRFYFFHLGSVSEFLC